MYKRIFLDANILADIYDESRPFFEYSDKVLKLLLADENVNLFTSCDIISTLYYILSKKDKKMTLDIIIEVNEWCEVIEFGNREIKECCTLMKKNLNFLLLVWFG